MSEQQPKEYIINERTVAGIELAIPDKAEALGKILRSRPHPAPAQETDHWCPYQKTDCHEGNTTHCDWPCERWFEWHDSAIERKAREDVLGLARDMYGLMMCVEKTNTDEFMEYYADRMKGLKEQYESLRSTQQQAGRK